MPEGIEVQGMKELQKILKKLDDKVQTKVIKSALRASGREVIKSARRKLPSEYGTLKRSLATKILKPTGGGVGLLVGARTTTITKSGNRKRPKYDGFYATMVELGTLGSRTEKLSASTKRKKQWTRKGTDAVYNRRGTPRGLRPRPFLRPAFRDSKTKIIDAFVTQVNKAVDKELSKAKK